MNRAPILEDFLTMKPAADLAGTLRKADHFVQFSPVDGAPETQRTEAYIGYDSKKLYVIFVCFESSAKQMHVQLGRRDDVGSDDNVFVYLDTFDDHRRAYVFASNPAGVQEDIIYTETNGYDKSFDTVWESKGKITEQGYIVWMAIPFNSLRFPATPLQTWGIFFERHIPHSSEDLCWPWISSAIDGFLNQEIQANGLENISPGRNMQFIPYISGRSFRALDSQTDPLHPFFRNRRADVKGGLDAKIVLKDSLVLDVTANPDFSQVESDDPQVTVNQRFAVFFPEKRPFFLENASFFQSPVNLVFPQSPTTLLFTRNIADPRFGVRLTGKIGPYSLGLLQTDDRSPGETAAASDPSFGKDAYVTAIRLSRDILGFSNVGVIFTDRIFNGSYNRVFGLDGRLKLNKNWAASIQAIGSQTKSTTGSYSAGPAYNGSLTRNGLHLLYDLEYKDRSPGFQTLLGFVNRVDIREVDQNVAYNFIPGGKHLLSWTPGLAVSYIQDHRGLRLDEIVNPSLTFSLQRQTTVSLGWQMSRDQLRPADFSALNANQDFSQKQANFSIASNFSRTLALSAQGSWGDSINFVPATGKPPFLAKSTNLGVTLKLHPMRSLQVDNTYLLTRLVAGQSGQSIFNDHILQSKWNYQITREMSLRFITQYNAVLPNSALTSLASSTQVNFDFLVTYLLHPGTAIYVGYNSDLQNLDPALRLNPLGQIQTGNRLINDGRQFFVKISYLFRP